MKKKHWNSHKILFLRVKSYEAFFFIVIIRFQEMRCQFKGYDILPISVKKFKNKKLRWNKKNCLRRWGTSVNFFIYFKMKVWCYVCISNKIKPTNQQLSNHIELREESCLNPCTQSCKTSRTNLKLPIPGYKINVNPFAIIYGIHFMLFIKEKWMCAW